MHPVKIEVMDVYHRDAFLTFTRWPEAVARQNISDLQSLVSLPNEDQFSMLQKTVHWLMELASDLISYTYLYIL